MVDPLAGDRDADRALDGQDSITEIRRKVFRVLIHDSLFLIEARLWATLEHFFVRVPVQISSVDAAAPSG